jgi:micrococcal nuclease
MPQKKNIKKYLYSVIIIITIFLFIVLRIFQGITHSPYPDKVYVTRVVDGDTFVDASKNRYRLIGVDTPELKRGKKQGEPLAKEAYIFTQKEIEDRTVRLTYDSDKFDRYQRLLVYVYTPDKKMLNKLLLKNGLAKVYRKQAFKEKKEFYKLQHQACQKKIGLWNKKFYNNEKNCLLTKTNSR